MAYVIFLTESEVHTLEELIKTIIEVDKKARKMTDESKKQLEESKTAIENRVKELDKQYEDSAEEIIQLTTEDESISIKQQEADIDDEFKSANEQLDKTFADNREKWVKEIVGRALAD